MSATFMICVRNNADFVATISTCRDGLCPQLSLRGNLGFKNVAAFCPLVFSTRRRCTVHTPATGQSPTQLNTLHREQRTTFSANYLTFTAVNHAQRASYETCCSHYTQPHINSTVQCTVLDSYVPRSQGINSNCTPM